MFTNYVIQLILLTVESEREKFAIGSLDTHQGLPHSIRREHMFEDVIDLYGNKITMILKEYPFRIKYTDEEAVDTGGVCRDLFSAFCEKAYDVSFDGAGVLVLAVHPHVDMALFPLLGAIFSHGFISSGFMPVRLSFPTVLALVVGTSVNIPESMLITSFELFLSSHERSVLRDALSECDRQVVSFTDDRVSQLVSIFGRYSCRQIPNPQNIQCLILQVAQHEFMTKPLRALNYLHSGVPIVHLAFWKRFSIEKLFALYNALKASPKQVLNRLAEPFAMSP